MAESHPFRQSTNAQVDVKPHLRTRSWVFLGNAFSPHIASPFLATPLIARFRNFFSVASTVLADGSAHAASRFAVAGDLAEDVRISRFGPQWAFLGCSC